MRIARLARLMTFAASTAIVAAVSGCGGAAWSRAGVAPRGEGATTGLELHETGGRPRLVAVRREGDPSAAIAVELHFEDREVGEDGEDDSAVRSTVLAAAIGARLERAGLASVQVIAGGTVARVRALVPELGARHAREIDAALTTPVGAGDAGAVRRAFEEVAARPIEQVENGGLELADRCLDRPTRPASYKPPPAGSLATTVERWRAAGIGPRTVIVAVVGGAGAVEGFTNAWRTLLPMTAGAPPSASRRAPPRPRPKLPGVSVGVSWGTRAAEGAIVVVAGARRSAVPLALAALSDPGGALNLRLRAADDWHVRNLAGAARAEGGCVVVEVGPSPVTRPALFADKASDRAADRAWSAERATMRAAVASEVARQEIDLALDEARAVDDAEAARVAVADAGDPREAADRAAWWGWPGRSAEASGAADARVHAATFLAPAPLIVKTPASTPADDPLASLRPKFAEATKRAALTWARAELDVRARAEPGQGEVWVALGTPCAVAHEGVGDAGLAAVAMRALVASAATRGAEGVVVEPWWSTTGVGVIAHAVPRSSESPRALAHRVGDVAARTFFASFPPADVVSAGRGEALAILATSPAAGLVHAALRAILPDRPSWLDANGAMESIAKVGPDAVDVRMATLRNGPLRLAVLSNLAPASRGDQGDAAAKAAERWIPRRPGEARSCPSMDGGTVPKAGVRALTVHAGTGVALAFPVDEKQRDAGALLAAALDGPTGRLAVDLGGLGLASSYEARLVRGVGRHALVIVALAPDANLDALAQKLRAVLENVRSGGLSANELSRAESERAAALLHRRLDPRARVIDLFTGDLGALSPSSPPFDLGVWRDQTAKILADDHAQLVVARLK